MLQSYNNIQALLDINGEIMQSWIIIPERQEESRFPYHKQFVHLSTVCEMLVRDSLREHWSCNSKTLFYLHQDWYGGWGESVKMTEWARAGLLNRTCTQSCTNCPELNKGRRHAKIECRMREL